MTIVELKFYYKHFHTFVYMLRNAQSGSNVTARGRWTVQVVDQESNVGIGWDGDEIFYCVIL